MRKHFAGQPDGSYSVIPALKTRVAFRKHDLLRDRYDLGFHLIMCRNVVIYSTDEAKASIYRRFFESLAPGGYLFVGGTERIVDYDAIGLDNRIPFFYKKPERH